MILQTEPKAFDLRTSEASVNLYRRSNRTVAEALVDFITPYDTDGMMSCERIAAMAAKLAHQFWLEIEDEFTYQGRMLDRLASSGTDIERR